MPATSTSGFGGGLFIEINHGSAVISGTTFSGNQAHSDAGGVAVSISKGPATIANSTIFGNSSASNGGGGVSLSSSEVPIAIRDSTISGNHSTGSNAGGGGISASENHPVRLEDTIVAGNSADAGGADLDGPIDAAFSLIGSPSGATLTETVAGSNLIGVDPQLGPLQNNGGPTETMAITASSPAVNKGAGGLGADQRGQLRPVAYPGVPFSAAAGANGADIGAFELQAPLPVVPSNRFHFGKVKLNKKKGTATVAVIVPGPGSMRLVGSKKVKKASKTAKLAGTVKLLLKAKGKALSTLKSSGKVKVKAKFTFAPTGGTPASKTKVVKLVRNAAAAPDLERASCRRRVDGARRAGRADAEGVLLVFGGRFDEVELGRAAVAIFPPVEAAFEGRAGRRGVELEAHRRPFSVCRDLLLRPFEDLGVGGRYRRAADGGRRDEPALGGLRDRRILGLVAEAVVVAVGLDVGVDVDELVGGEAFGEGRSFAVGERVDPHQV